MKNLRTWMILDGYEVTLYKKAYIVRTPQGRYITNRHNRPKRFVLLRHVQLECEQHAMRVGGAA